MLEIVLSVLVPIELLFITIIILCVEILCVEILSSFYTDQKWCFNYDYVKKKIFKIFK